MPENFDDSLVIIDEIHNLINGVKNQAKNAEAIYAKLMTSDCRILALSGTPVFNNIFEWSLLGNLLKPDSVPPIIISGHLETKGFMNMFNIADDGYLTAKDPVAFKKATEGIVSYFPGLGGGLYPTVIEEEIIKVPMTPEQEHVYWPEFNKEEAFIKIPLNPLLRVTNPAKYEFQKRMKVIAKKRIMSRQPSNFIYPKEIVGQVIVGEDTEEGGHSHTIKPKDAVVPKGWVERKYFSDGELKEKYSTKMAALFDNILNNFRSKHMVFTFFNYYLQKGACSYWFVSHGYSINFNASINPDIYCFICIIILQCLQLVYFPLYGLIGS